MNEVGEVIQDTHIRVYIYSHKLRLFIGEKGKLTQPNWTKTSSQGLSYAITLKALDLDAEFDRMAEDSFVQIRYN